MIELSNGMVIKQWQNPCIICYRNYSKKTDPEDYYREKLMLFYHWRKEDIFLICTFNTYEEHYKALEDQIVPVQLKFERNNDILQVTASSNVQSHFKAKCWWSLQNEISGPAIVNNPLGGKLILLIYRHKYLLLQV